MVLTLAVLLLGLAAFLAGEVATDPQRRRHQGLKRVATYGRSRREGAPVELVHFRERVLAPTVKRLAAVAIRLNPKASAAAIGTRLVAAGLAARFSATQFLALKSGIAIASALVALLLGVETVPAAG